MKNFSGLLLLACLFTGIGKAQELHTHSNAASISNEANSTTGWGGSATRTVSTTETYSGSYSIKLEAPNTGWNYAGYSFSTTASQEYLITIYAKSDTTDDPRIYYTGDLVSTSSTQITDTNWALYSKTVEATGTQINVNVYPGTPATNGGAIYIDHISITPVNGADTQAPIAPTLQSNGQSQTTVDLSWSGATDNVGVTGYNIYRDGNLEANPNSSPHTVTGLTAGTSYSFTVTALDAAGNESVASNAVSVTTDSSSGGGTSVWSESGSTASYTGEVAIGTSSVPTGYKLAVDGHIRTREIRVDQDTWPDYVFEENYNLLSLEEIQEYINKHGHLPNMPSAMEVKTNGVELGAMDRLLLQKIEELTLYILDQQEQIQKLTEQYDSCSSKK